MKNDAEGAREKAAPQMQTGTHKPGCNRLRFNKNHACSCHSIRNGAELVSEKLSDGSTVWNVALTLGEQTMVVNMASHSCAEAFASDFNRRVSRGHIVGA